MAVNIPENHFFKPARRARRTATTVLAGNFDIRPPDDVLTCLLNDMSPYTPMLRLNGDEARRQHKRKKKERERETKLARLPAKVQDNPLGEGVDAVSVVNGFSTSMPQPSAATKAFLQAGPSIHIATMQRSVSVTPPPFASPLLLPSIPASTPGPSNSPSTWRISSKRPPSDDYVDLVRSVHERPSSSRKPRASAKKGWKGWVEGSPPPSGKLINLETVPVFPERRTRSGKNFDAIGVGKDGWV